MTPWIAVGGALALAFEGIQYDPVLYPPEVFESDEVEGGEMRTDGGGALVLRHQDIVVEVHGGIARITMVQAFQNPYDTPLEADYLLPLPSTAAVDVLEVTVGDRRIEGTVMEREAARRAFDEAVTDGRRAALLEQARENLFRQRVAGICPGEDVTVTVQYALVVPFEDGLYALALPTTIGKRYTPPWVGDPGDVHTPYGDGAPTLDLTVYLDEGMPIEALFSDSHEILVEDEGTWGAIVRFPEAAPDRDLELSWSIAGEQPRAAVLTHRADPAEDGYLALTLEPQVLGDRYVAQKRELLFVIDESGSMAGEPFEAARAVVLHALDQMRPEDTFNVVSFSSEARTLYPSPRRSTAQSRAEARAWLEVFDGQGTNMDRGIVHSLTQPGDPEALRLVLMITDGFITGEEDMFALVRRHLGDARLFALGVGASTNRFLLEGLAEMGRGDVDTHVPGANVGAAVETFYGRIAHPAMTDVTIDWGELDVHDVYPKQVPDLWAGQPLRVLARYGSTGQASVRVTGTVGGESVTIEVPVSLRDEEGAHEALAPAWARQRIRDVTWYPGSRSPAQVRAEVTDLAIDHHLVSAYTSLVAIDDRPCPCGIVGTVQEVPHMQPAFTAGTSSLYGSGTGGGMGSSAMGFGGLGTRGMAVGGGGFGAAGGSFGAKGEGSIATIAGDPIILGGVDRSAIDEVLRRNLNVIRYCYQRALTARPELAGRVVTRFVIAADGSVSSAAIKTSTLGSAEAEQCIVGKIQKLTFPQPNGGGVVVVSYPFVFTPGR